MTIHCKTQWAGNPNSVSIISLKALGMVYFGIQNSDPAVRNAGFAQHSAALEAIRLACSTPGKAHTGDIIAAIALASLFTVRLKISAIYTSSY